MTFSSIRRSFCFRLISLCLMITFITTMVITPKAQAGVMGLPQPGTMVNLSVAYVPLMITGLTVHPNNPLLMDFIVSTGNSGLNATQVKKESDRLIKYFLACLTIPENNQWVNLSPYEKQRIVPEDLGQTVLGQDMLEQDYLLKQLTASLIYPEKNLGKNFWDKVYAKANQMYGTTQIPVNTFNKVWILPDTAKVFEHKDTVFVVKSHLKVMLDEDYLALSKNASKGPIASSLQNGVIASPKGEAISNRTTNNLGSQIIRQIILPAIEKEVNTGQNFAQLRQIYNSMILAVWFKKNLKEALLNQVYTDKSKVNGVNVDDPAIKEKIYKQYLQAYKKGVFNYIKEEPVMSSPNVSDGDLGHATIARKYFSGGLTAVTPAILTPATVDEAMASLNGRGENFKVSGITQGAPGNMANNTDAAMLNIPDLKSKLGAVVYQRGEGIAFFKRNIKFQGSQRESPVGTMIASPQNISVDVQHLKNAQGNLWMTDRRTNRREYTTSTDQPRTSDSKLIRSTYLPFGTGMADSLRNKPGTQPLTWLDFSNNFGNPNYVSFTNGRLYFPTGFNLGEKFEQNFTKPLFSFVQYPDGKIDFENVRFEVTNTRKVEGYYDEVFARVFAGERELPSEAVIFSAIPLVVDGKPADLSSAIQAGIFQDLRQLFVFPPLKNPENVRPGEYALADIPKEIRAGVFFGLEELAANNYVKAAEALNQPVSLPMSVSVSATQRISLNQTQVKDLLATRGYLEETDQRRIEKRQPEEGKYIFISDSEIIIFLKPNPYPHLLIGRTDDGNILVQSIGGASGSIGITIKEAFSYAQKLGVRDLMSVSQGTGSLIGYLPEGLEHTPEALEKGNHVIVGASEGRQAGSAVINILSRPVSKVKTDLNTQEVTIGSSAEEIDELQDGVGKGSDSAMATSIQITRGVAYWEGKTATTSITRPIRASRQEDVPDITDLSLSEKLRLERIAIQSLLKGQGVIGMLAAGSSSRMNVKDAPPEVQSMSHENIQSKAGVPIGVIDGQAITYLDAFGINVDRMMKQLNEEAVSVGEGNNQLKNNDVLLFSNDDYKPEQARLIAAHHNYGLPQQIRFLYQPLEPIYWATPADVEKLRAKFKTEDDYQAALLKAKDVQARLAQGQQDAVITQNQRDPLGHGEFLHQLVASGELLHMFYTGKKWFFIKNVDNYAAKLDRVWLQILGKFLSQNVDFQPEVSPRAPAQSGGDLIVMQDTGSQRLAEGPELKATVGADGKPIVNIGDSFWFNDGVAFGRPEYVASLYLKPGQTLDEFLVEYRKAVESKDKEALEAIAERGRAKFPKLLDPKPAKDGIGATVKIETNMWQSTGVAPENIRIKAIGVRGARNFDINKYPLMSPQEKLTELANLRFLATKQWTVAPGSRVEAKMKLENLLDRKVTDAEVDLTLESYEGNKRVADDLLHYILTADLITKGILSGKANAAIATAKDLAKLYSNKTPYLVGLNMSQLRGELERWVSEAGAMVTLQEADGTRVIFRYLSTPLDVDKFFEQSELSAETANKYSYQLDYRINEKHETDLGNIIITRFAAQAASQAMTSTLLEFEKRLIRLSQNPIGLEAEFSEHPTDLRQVWKDFNNAPPSSAEDEAAMDRVMKALSNYLNPRPNTNAAMTTAKKAEIRIIFADAPESGDTTAIETELAKLQAIYPGVRIRVINEATGVGKNPEALMVAIKKWQPPIVVVRSATKAFSNKTPGYEQFFREASANGVKVVLRSGVGIDNVDRDAGKENNITVARTHGSANSVADLTLYLASLIPNMKIDGSFFKNVPASLSGGQWQSMANTTPDEYLKLVSSKFPKDLQSSQSAYSSDTNRYLNNTNNAIMAGLAKTLNGQVFGIVGLGAIPVTLMVKIGMIQKSGVSFEVIGSTRSFTGDSQDAVNKHAFAQKIGMTPVGREELFKRATILSLHVGEPAAEITEAELDSAKNLKVIINTSRLGAFPLRLARRFLERGGVLVGDLDLNTELIGLIHEFPGQVIILPHIGASTQGAKDGVEENTIPSLLEAAQLLLGQERSSNIMENMNGVPIKEISASPAMTTVDFTAKPVTQSKNTGGIDLNSRNLTMESTGQKVNITFNAAMIAQFRRGDFSGVKIQILEVVPVNLVPLLGLKEEEGFGQLAKV